MNEDSGRTSHANLWSYEQGCHWARNHPDATEVDAQNAYDVLLRERDLVIGTRTAFLAGWKNWKEGKP